MEKAQAIEAFQSLEEFHKLMAEFSTKAYITGATDLRAKVEGIFLDLV